MEKEIRSAIRKGYRSGGDIGKSSSYQSWTIREIVQTLNGSRVYLGDSIYGDRTVFECLAPDEKIFFRDISECSSEIHFDGVSTDTRKFLEGKLFLALKGEVFDAHDYLEVALEKGASGLLIHHYPESLRKKIVSEKSNVPIILVKNTLQALQDLGHSVRKKSKAKFIAITGSNGKTSTKEFASQIISFWKEKVHWNMGSFNNHWGVPLTLLEMPEDTDIAILEMGMNHKGELSKLCQIVEPDIVLCTTVGRAHLEHFSDMDELAQSKKEIYIGCADEAIRIFNLDNEWTRKMYESEGNRLGDNFPHLTFSDYSKKTSAPNENSPNENFQVENSMRKDGALVKKYDVQLQLLSQDWEGIRIGGIIQGVSGECHIPIWGGHHIVNLMSASCIAIAVGLTPQEIWTALPQCKTAWGRTQRVETESGALVLFDAYNANPDSMKALIETIRNFSSPKGRLLGVFAEMLELGSLSQNLHRELGYEIVVGSIEGGNSELSLHLNHPNLENKVQKSLNWEKIWFYGPHYAEFAEGVYRAGFQGTLIVTSEFDENIAKKMAEDLQDGDCLVLKGSRGMYMERIVHLCHPNNFKIK